MIASAFAPRLRRPRRDAAMARRRAPSPEPSARRDLQRRIILLGLADRRAIILAADHDQGRRLHVADQRQRRARPDSPAGPPTETCRTSSARRRPAPSAVSTKLAQSITGFCVAAALKRLVLPTIQAVSTPPPEPPVTNRWFGIGEALRDRRVDRGHQIVIILAGIGMVDQVGEFLAIGGRAARVGRRAPT